MIDGKLIYRASLLRTKRITALLGILCMVIGLCFTVHTLQQMEPPSPVEKIVNHQCGHPGCSPTTHLVWDSSWPIGLGTGTLCLAFLIASTILIGTANE